MPNLPGELLLARARVRAETKLIKSRLMKKLHEGLELSETEKAYIKNWIEQIKRCGDELKAGSTCVPMLPTDMTFSQLSTLDRYNLNAIPLVQLSPDLGSYGLTDLALELSQFVDDSTLDLVLDSA